MSADGIADITLKPGCGEGYRIAVVSASWNADITDRLHAHAVSTLRELGVLVDDWRVVGCMELPVVVKAALQTHDAVVANGCVIRGDTAHFDYVCRSVTDGLTRAALDSGRPVGNGVLTVETLEQAVERSGVPGAVEDKGADAARAALHTLLVLDDIGTRG